MASLRIHWTKDKAGNHRARLKCDTNIHVGLAVINPGAHMVGGDIVSGWRVYLGPNYPNIQHLVTYSSDTPLDKVKARVERILNGGIRVTQ